jgi:hypothetical protein
MRTRNPITSLEPGQVRGLPTGTRERQENGGPDEGATRSGRQLIVYGAREETEGRGAREQW